MARPPKNPIYIDLAEAIARLLSIGEISENTTLDSYLESKLAISREWYEFLDQHQDPLDEEEQGSLVQQLLDSGNNS